jgi:hypothetical protein
MFGVLGTKMTAGALLAKTPLDSMDHKQLRETIHHFAPSPVARPFHAKKLQANPNNFHPVLLYYCIQLERILWT